MGRVVLVTGVSSGLGQAFARALLAAGDTVIGTVRGAAAAEAFGELAPGRAHPLVLDVTDFAAVAPAIAGAAAAAGPIDALVNNAGYGAEGTLEESGLDECRRQFDANLFGAVAVIQAVLPGMRERRRGRIVNVTSMGGTVALPGVSFYCASKFALEGITEALAAEVAPFGIRVTALAPGQFRTDWAGRSMRRAPRTIADYDAVMDPIRAARMAKSGGQRGDPARAAAALLELLAADDPPGHLFLGPDALALVEAKMERLRGEMARWDAVSRGTDFA